MTPIKRISREPTEKQLKAALNADVGVLDSTLRELYTLIYQAMVDAAPDSESEAEKMAKHLLSAYAYSRTNGPLAGDLLYTMPNGEIAVLDPEMVVRALLRE